jgi:hypothetical protein
VQSQERETGQRLPTWWQKYPSRLASELEELDRANIRYEQVGDRDATGVIRLRLFPVVAGKELRLDATFPDLYPYFRFEVSAPELSLPVHQHAQSKQLCFLPRPTSYWMPATDRLAHFIIDRLPIVLAAASTSDNSAVTTDEERIAEPYSDYYTYASESILLVDSAWSIPPSILHGTFVANMFDLSPIRFRGYVDTVSNDAGDLLCEAEEGMRRLPVKPVRGRWCRLSAPIPADLSSHDTYKHAAQCDPTPEKLPTARIDDVSIRLRAVVYPEQVRWRGEPANLGDAWLFAIKVFR